MADYDHDDAPAPAANPITAVASLGRVMSRPAHGSNYSRARREPRMVVLHCTQGAEGCGAVDANVAAMWARPDVRTSAHYVVDADSVTHCVPDMLIAWHAGHTANLLGIGVEICGWAEQTRAEWLDAMSLSTLCRAARLVADLCAEYRIPVVYLDDVALNTQRPHGITTHADVSRAWRESSHWDPGSGFPVTDFVGAVAVAVAARAHV